MIKTIAFSFSKVLKNSRLFLFAGQGTQEVGMLAAIPAEQQQQTLKLAQQLLNVDFSQVASIDSNKLINQTEVTQPLLLLSHYLHFRHGKYNEDLSAEDWMIGHSLGQYSALVNSGSLQLDQALKLVYLRGKLMKKYTTKPHGMLIVKYKPQKQDIVFEQIKKAGLQIACINTRTNIIVAGEMDLLRELAKVLKSHQTAALSLPVSNASHCRILAAMNDQFSQTLRNVKFRVPKCKVLRNYDCLPYTNQQSIRQGLVLQLTNPVRFAESVQKVPLQTQVIEVSHKAWISKFAQEVRRASFLNELI